MKLFNWLRRGNARETAAVRADEHQPLHTNMEDQDDDPAKFLRWIPAEESPFGIEVFDCFAFASSMVALTSDGEIARRFTELRGSRGEQCRTDDRSGTIVDCHLDYPLDRHADGPVFLAQQMEDKWDVFLLHNELWFSRSWTGEVVYRAAVTFDDSRAVIAKIRTLREPAASDDPVAVVDYLVKSHLYGLVAPHPLVGAPEGSDKDIAMWSFSHYGRRGVCGTRADATHLGVRRQQDGRCVLARPV